MTTRTATLDSVCSRISSGGTPSRKKAEYFTTGLEGHLWVKSKELLDGFIQETEETITDEGLNNSAAKYFPAHSVLIAMYGANVGQLGWLRVPATVNQAICGLVLDDQRADWRFVFYELLQHRWDLTVQAHGTAQQNLNQDLIRQFSIRLPPLPQQRRIAGILSAYDDLIENNQRRIRILETMARALYREWFVEFRFPGHEKLPRVVSPLGDIPQGWETKPLGEVAHIFRGRSYRSVDLAGEGGLPFLNLKCIDRDGGFRRSGLKRYTGEYRDTHIAKKGDIVVAVTDMTQERRIVARAALVPTLKREFGVYSMDLVRVEPRPPMPGEFLYAFLRYSSFGDEVKQHANGVNVLHLAPKRITEFQLVVPPIDLIRQFTGVSAPTLGQMDTLESQIENLRCTRDLLLPRLLSGQVTLTDTAA